LRDRFLARESEAYLEERDKWWGLNSGFWNDSFLRSTAESVTREVVEAALLKEGNVWLVDLKHSIMEPFYRTETGTEHQIAKLNATQRTFYFVSAATWIILDEGIDQFENKYVHEVIGALKQIDADKAAAVLEEYVAWSKEFGVDLDNIGYDDDANNARLREISNQFYQAWEADDVERKAKKFIKEHLNDFVYHG
jgi:hypothetical protein